MSSRSVLKSVAARLADRSPLLVDLYRLALHPRWEIANWLDYVATHRAIAWLRELPDPPREAPAALVVLRREDIFDVKSSLMLGSALRLEGVRPVVLAHHRRVPRIRRYARAFGVRSMRYRDEVHLSKEAVAGIEKLVRELLAEPGDFEAVRGWTYRGQPMGQRVLSTLIRRTLQGEPDPGDPALRSLLESILRRVLCNYHQAGRVLDSVRPSWVFADETGYADNGPLVDVALSRGLDVLEASPFVTEGALMLKRMSAELGRAPSASVSRCSLERLAKEGWSAGREAELDAEFEVRYSGRSALHRMYQWHTRPVGREEICRELRLDPRLPIAVVFSHVLWDASFFYGEDLFATYQRWLERTVLAAMDNPRVSWLIKTHPANAFRLAHGDVTGPVAEVEVVRRCARELPAHVRLVMPETPISSLSLYRHADLGVTVRSTAGLEMACFGKPVVTAGTGHYSGLGFTHDSRSPEEYLGRLQHLESLAAPLSREQTTEARRYAYALFKLRPWIAQSFELRLEFPERGWHPLDRNVVPSARTLGEARRHGDLHRFARWAVRSESADYLEDVPP